MDNGTDGADGVDGIEEGRAQALLLLGEARVMMSKLMEVMRNHPGLQKDPVLIDWMEAWQVEINDTMGDEIVKPGELRRRAGL